MKPSNSARGAYGPVVAPSALPLFPDLAESDRPKRPRWMADSEAIVQAEPAKPVVGDGNAPKAEAL